jgi:hypothetical protein
VYKRRRKKKEEQVRMEGAMHDGDYYYHIHEALAPG